MPTLSSIIDCARIKDKFPDVKLDWTDYFNCGFVVLNEKHKDLCTDILMFWEDNDGELTMIQNTISKGTDQTPVNYIVKRDVEINYLSKKFNLPYDIIKSIFKINRNNDRQIEEEIRFQPGVKIPAFDFARGGRVSYFNGGIVSLLKK